MESSVCQTSLIVFHWVRFSHTGNLLLRHSFFPGWTAPVISPFFNDRCSNFFMEFGELSVSLLCSSKSCFLPCFLLAGSWSHSSWGHCNKVGSDLHTPGQVLLVCECGLHLPLLIPGHSEKQTGLHFCSLLIFFSSSDISAFTLPPSVG